MDLSLGGIVETVEKVQDIFDSGDTEAVDSAATDKKLEKADLKEVADSEWVCSCFISPSENSFDYEMAKRYYTRAVTKVGGSGLGEGRVINMPPGINEFCDLPMGYGVDGTQDSNGMGVAYSELYDDNLDIIHIRPGLPRYSSLARFYTTAVQSEAVSVGEYGWFNRAVSAVASAAGYLLTVPFRIVATPFNVLGKMLSNDDTNRYSYYYLAPAPHTFWKALDNIVNDFAIRSGLIPGAAFADAFDDGSQATKVMRDEDVDYFIKNIPGVYREGKFGFPRIDVLAISARHSIMMNAKRDALIKKINALSGSEADDDYIAKYTDLMMYHNPWDEEGVDAGLAGVQKVGAALDNAGAAMYTKYDEINRGSIHSVIDADGQTKTVSQDVDGNVVTVDDPESVGSKAIAPEMDDTSFTENFKTVVAAGADWISLAVDHVSESTISISNTSGPSGLASTINAMVSTMRGANFNMAGGNIGDGMLANAMEGAISTAGAAVSGLASSFLGGMPSAILGGKAFIDIPDVYQESSMEFNQLAYTITSTSTSGHPLAKLRMLMPYFVLLTLASPRSGGPSSYIPPFLVEVQHKGRGIVQLGMLDSLSATFGELDGWDINDIPNQVQIQFSVVNLSKGFHIPIDPDASMTYTDTGAFSLHMSVLAGTSLTDRDRSLFYNLKRSAMGMAQKVDRFTSATYWAHMTGSAIRAVDPGFLNAFGVYTNRR